MTLPEAIRFVESLKGKPLQEFVERFGEGRRPLPPNRWSVEVNGDELGRVVAAHDVGIDLPGTYWAEWQFNEHETVRTLRVECDEGGDLMVALDGKVKPNGALAFDSDDGREESPCTLIVAVSYDDGSCRRYRFSGKVV